MENMKHAIYADHAATTNLCSDAWQAMKTIYEADNGNASSVYKIGREARRSVETSRREIAKLIGANQREIFFTSCGTESDNWALKSYMKKYASKSKHLITTSVEHHAILNTCRDLEEAGYEVTYLPVDHEGRIDLTELEKAIRDDTVLISVMMANNEVGTIYPIHEIAEIAHRHQINVHTDAVQAVGHLPVNVQELGVDMLSFSGHKFGGPKGVGCLYIRSGVDLPPFLSGGGQETGKRGGTENVAGIAGLAAALRYSIEHLETEQIRQSQLRDQLIRMILSEIPDVRLTGDAVNRLPGHASFQISGVEGETLLLILDSKGIYASSGSACAAGSLDPSHVLMAMGLTRDEAKGSLRLTLGEENTSEDICQIVTVLKQTVEMLRNI